MIKPQFDGIGFGLGEWAAKISMESKIDVIGELTINEWNGMKKPQIMIEDMQVQQRQYFDWRGAKHLERKWDQIFYLKKAAFCFFRENEELCIQRPAHFESICFNENGTFKDNENINIEEIDTFILFDLPKTMEQFQKAMSQLKHGHRLYLLFQHQEQHFFSTIPSREHFKWFFAFIQQKGSFNLQNNSIKLAQHKGWTKDSILFMARVFLELEFATIENGVIQLNPVQNKRELFTIQDISTKTGRS